jgi:hypothetical protein
MKYNLKKEEIVSNRYYYGCRSNKVQRQKTTTVSTLTVKRSNVTLKIYVTNIRNKKINKSKK